MFVRQVTTVYLSLCSLFCLLSKQKFLNLSCLTRGNWCIHCLFITHRAGVPIHRGKVIGWDAQRTLRLCKYTQKHTWKYAHAETYNCPTPKHFNRVAAGVHAHAQQRDLPMHAYAQIVKDLVCCWQRNTEHTALISIQTGQTLSNEKADTLFTISASSSPLWVKQIHTHLRLLCSTSPKWSTAHQQILS